MSRHHRQPRPTPTPAPPTPLYRSARYERLLFVLSVLVGAAALVATFFAGFAAGSVVARG